MLLEASILEQLKCQLKQISKILIVETYRNKLRNSILLPKLFLPTVRKNCSGDQKNHMKFEAEGQDHLGFSDLIN